MEHLTLLLEENHNNFNRLHDELKTAATEWVNSHTEDWVNEVLENFKEIKYWRLRKDNRCDYIYTLKINVDCKNHRGCLNEYVNVDDIKKVIFNILVQEWNEEELRLDNESYGRNDKSKIDIRINLFTYSPPQFVVEHFHQKIQEAAKKQEEEIKEKIEKDGSNTIKCKKFIEEVQDSAIEKVINTFMDPKNWRDIGCSTWSYHNSCDTSLDVPHDLIKQFNKKLQEKVYEIFTDKRYSYKASWMTFGDLFHCKLVFGNKSSC